jgi:hypothetical protein
MRRGAADARSHEVIECGGLFELAAGSACEKARACARRQKGAPLFAARWRGGKRAPRKTHQKRASCGSTTPSSLTPPCPLVALVRALPCPRAHLILLFAPRAHCACPFNGAHTLVSSFRDAQTPRLSLLKLTCASAPDAMSLACGGVATATAARARQLQQQQSGSRAAVACGGAATASSSSPAQGRLRTVSVRAAWRPSAASSG